MTVAFIVVVAVGVYLYWQGNKRTAEALESLHKLINSRMDEWVAAEKATSRNQGHEEGVTQERVDARDRRDLIIKEADEQSAV